MADYPVLTVLPIGMGSCNLIEVYDDDAHTKLKYLAMVDCGSDEGGAQEESFDYISRKMQERYNCNKDCYLDMFLLTHQDSDHWDKVRKLIDSKIYGETQYYEIKSIPFDEEYPKFYKLYFRSNGKIRMYHTIHPYSRDNYYEYQFGHKYLYETTSNEYNIQIIFSTFSTKEIKYIPKNVPLEYCMIESLRFPGNMITFETQNHIDYICYYGRKEYSFTSQNNASLEAIYCSFISQHPNVIDLDLYKDAYNVAKGITATIINNDLAVTDTKTVPIIKNTYFGGDGYIKRRRSDNFKEIFLKACSESVKDIFNMEISPNIEMICRLNANNYTQENTSGVKKNLRNATSAVTIWNYNANTKYLLTGDATADTMVYILKKSNDSYEEAIMTSPHHGSTNTSHGTYGKDGKDGKQADVLEDFIETLKPKAMVISASYANKHGLPGEEFVNKCEENMTPSSNDTNYICYYKEITAQKTDDANWFILKPTKAIYSTVQYNPSTEHPENEGTYPLHYYHHQFTNMEHGTQDYGDVKTPSVIKDNSYIWNPLPPSTIPNNAQKRKSAGLGDDAKDFKKPKLTDKTGSPSQSPGINKSFNHHPSPIH